MMSRKAENTVPFVDDDPEEAELFKSKKHLKANEKVFIAQAVQRIDVLKNSVVATPHQQANPRRAGNADQLQVEESDGSDSDDCAVIMMDAAPTHAKDH